MEINGIGSQYINTLSSLMNTDGKDSGKFQDIFSDALKQAEAADAASQAGSQALLTGDVNDIAGVMIDSEKATIALDLTVQIRNKIIDAYNEVMRMQV